MNAPHLSNKQCYCYNVTALQIDFRLRDNFSFIPARAIQNKPTRHVVLKLSRLICPTQFQCLQKQQVLCDKTSSYYAQKLKWLGLLNRQFTPEQEHTDLSEVIDALLEGEHNDLLQDRHGLLAGRPHSRQAQLQHGFQEHRRTGRLLVNTEGYHHHHPHIEGLFSSVKDLPMQSSSSSSSICEIPCNKQGTS